MIAARQVSKPIADAVLRYGKDHPVFRNKLLIPIGRGLVRFTSRMRMKRLGLGEPITHAPVSEAAALEQASDFVQQLVLFSYSVGVFASYYFYTKLTTPESLKIEEYNDFKEQQERAIKELRLQIESLEQRLAAQQKRNFFSQLGFSKDEEPPKGPSGGSNATSGAPNGPSESSKEASGASESSKPSKPSESLKERFQRISSLPIDAAASLILDDEEYLIVRRDTSVGIELSVNFAARGERLRYRIPSSKLRESLAQLALKEAACHVIGS
ncbi:Protein CBG01435 [Caenorhabditis briggsae]|nr:Protein CBG01435 [Caenorhabditis briggsae]CAP22706.2 Protein CBG01435 [Caenorhabditis briggsae]